MCVGGWVIVWTDKENASEAYFISREQHGEMESDADKLICAEVLFNYVIKH